ncbi:MAG TPA: hypothetical protein VMV09_08145 [Candidatus Saccharimonadales bacterium]|nr:hypothetical protein [Candidatus Saccharimonadales bacterium]
MSPLNASHGEWLEDTVRRLGADLGVPDFVYLPAVVAKGRATREVGDGFLISGQKGAILQVKSRDAKAGINDGPETLHVLEKMVDDAARQAQGSRREIERRWDLGTPVSTLPFRALSLPAPRRDQYLLKLTRDAATWPSIIVVDHPLAGGHCLKARPDALVLTLSDWRDLHRALSSTAAFITYAERVLGADPAACPPLGCESLRFKAVVEADRKWVTAGGPTARPWVAGPAEPTSVGLINELIAHVWEDDSPVPWTKASDYRRIVAVLDGVPPGARDDLAQGILRARARLTEHGQQAGWTSLLNDEQLIVYSCDFLENHGSPGGYLAWIATVTQCRREQWAEQSGLSVSALGVGLLLRKGSPSTLYCYCYLDGDVPRLAPELRAEVERVRGSFTPRRRGPRHSDPD